MLKAVVETVPEGLESFYTEKNGEYHLQVEGMVEKTKFEEFRENNRKLFKDLQAFEGVDPEQYRRWEQELKDRNNQKLLDEGKIDELLAAKAEELQKKHAEEYGALQTQKGVLEKQLEGLMIDNAVRDQAIKHGIAATAMADVLSRAKAIFQLKDGQAIPMDSNGNVIYSEGSTNPISMDSWVKGLAETAPHLFNPSQGAGSQHGQRGDGAGKTMPRADFDSLPDHRRKEFLTNGGKLTD